jgi:hypothetical protein
MDHLVIEDYVERTIEVGAPNAFTALCNDTLVGAHFLSNALNKRDEYRAYRLS